MSQRELLEQGTVEAAILGTYREMPGLSLHLDQAARLFRLQVGRCRVVLEELVRRGDLRRTTGGQYTWR